MLDKEFNLSEKGCGEKFLFPRTCYDQELICREGCLCPKCERLRDKKLAGDKSK